MKIVFHHDGALGEHFIDTTDPQVIATFAAINGNPLAQIQAGWHVPSAHPQANPNEHCYDFVRRRLQQPDVPANDPLKMLALK